VAPATDTALVAELEVLGAYDAMRERAGHDYGAGQRAAELIRRRRELEARGIDREEFGPVELAELERAWRRLAVPRYRRARADSERFLPHGTMTPSTRRTLETWRRLARVYGLEL
jgi:hypothetical protein